MAERQETFTITCPGNTAQATPVEIPLPTGVCWVRTIIVRIPRGHAGITGLRFAFGHTVIIPATSGAWIIGDSATRTFVPRSAGNSGAWTAFAYNTDNRAHYWSVDMEIDEIASALSPELLAAMPREPLPMLSERSLGSRIRVPSRSGAGTLDRYEWQAPSDSDLSTEIQQ